MDYSVLMSVYKREKVINLRLSLDSIFSQTKKSNDIVLVCDGVLTEELDTLISELQSLHSELHVYRLKENQGLGKALNFGLSKCLNEIVARMDTDDISAVNRMEKELAIIANGDSSVIGSNISEFYDFEENVVHQRVVPETHEEILSFAKLRNPMNHMTVMFKKSEVLSVGGYKHFPFLEDYFLWVRMIQRGYRFYNIQENLVNVRSGIEMYNRRSGLEVLYSNALFSFKLKQMCFLSYSEFIRNFLSRTVITLLPASLKKNVYERFLRKK